MTGSFQRFLLKSIPEAAKDLEEAFGRIPEDKREWSPSGTARTAIDLMAECAMLSDVTEMVRTHSFPADFDFESYVQAKKDLAGRGWETVQSLLRENVEKTVAVIPEVPDSDLDIEIQMPWGNVTVAQAISYPYWNMSYHTRQLNYLASMLGTLET
jgi:hypothetical protein